MCNINVIIRKNGVKSPRLSECMNVVSYQSFQRNSDAEGYYCEDFKVRRSVHKQIIKGNHSMIVSHQRFSTSGKNADMTQPLESEHFILTHNGVFSGLGSVDKSDSFQYLEKLEQYYQDCEHNTREALRNLNLETGGSYSVILYNKETREFLYYKNSSTDMFIARTEEYLFMSTVESNVEYMLKYFQQFADIEPVDQEKFYSLSGGEFKYISKFKPYVYVAPKTTTTQVYPDYWKQYQKAKDEETGSDYKRNRITWLLDEYGIGWKKCGLHGDKALVTIEKQDDSRLTSLFNSRIHSTRGDYCRYWLNINELIKEAEAYERALNGKEDGRLLEWFD